jgi:hypothetical protein
MGKSFFTGKGNALNKALAVVFFLNIIFYSIISLYVPSVPRYLLPSYSILILFAAREIAEFFLSGAGGTFLRRLALSAAVVIIILPGAVHGGEQLGIWHRQSQPVVEMSQWISTNTEENAVIGAAFPPLVSYYGKRKTVYVKAKKTKELEKSIGMNGKNLYLILDSQDPGSGIILKDIPFKLEEIKKIKTATLYRILPN